MVPVLFLLAALAAGAPAPHEFVIGEKLSGSVGFYDANGVRTADVRVGRHPHEMALSPDRRTVYVSDNGVVWMTEDGPGDNTVSIIDIASHRRTGVINLGSYRRPHGITVDRRTGHIFVTTERPSALVELDPVSRKVVRAYDVKGKAPHIVVLGPGSVFAYTSNDNSGTISAIRLATGEVKVIPAGKRPQGQALSPDGKFDFITLEDDNTIAILDTAKNEIVGRIGTGRSPNRVAVTPDGKLLVYSMQLAGAVGFADIAARKQIAQVPVGGQTMSIALSPDAQLAYTGIQEHDQIAVVSVRDRKLVRTFKTAPGSGPDAIIPLW
jgi:DNA-binding beta-propeller fold protein YncE